MGVMTVSKVFWLQRTSIVSIAIYLAQFHGIMHLKMRQHRFSMSHSMPKLLEGWLTRVQGHSFKRRNCILDRDSRIRLPHEGRVAVPALYPRANSSLRATFKLKSIIFMHNHKLAKVYILDPKSNALY